MNTDKNRQPAGIPEGGQFAGHLHSEGADLVSGHPEPRQGPMFSEEDLVSTRYGKAVQIVQLELDELSKSRIRNRRRIKVAKEAHRVLSADYKRAVTNPAAKNEEWHSNHPDVPAWAHEKDLYVTGLYKQLRGFQVVAEGPRPESRLYSPGLNAAREALHHSQLSDADRDTLNQYFHKHDWHDCKDHSQPWSRYWEVQDGLDQVARKIAPMDQPVTVWRGESYSEAKLDFDGSNVRKLARIQYLLDLKPGDPFMWENCTATSLSLTTAAQKFSGKRRPEDFRTQALLSANQNVSHSVLFELETDRGVYVDDELTEAKHSNESEILLPREMRFEVVGHAQLGAENVSKNERNTAYHLIKLKMSTS